MTGERIKKLRKEKGLTQEQLGNLLGVKNQPLLNMKTIAFPTSKRYNSKII
ncbi:helix-turn-helix transcriptional regulator [Coprobacillaceae bacterium CR2/5/TPMF4]|nr:helix-turn-helix transcriptional regulator [Coprobacillaceae bacterium CR2/5/TPMF4]